MSVYESVSYGISLNLYKSTKNQEFCTIFDVATTEYLKKNCVWRISISWWISTKFLVLNIEPARYLMVCNRCERQQQRRKPHRLGCIIKRLQFMNISEKKTNFCLFQWLAAMVLVEFFFYFRLKRCQITVSAQCQWPWSCWRFKHKIHSKYSA